MPDMTMTMVCGHCFQNVPHNLSPKPLTTESWTAVCCGCCNAQTLSNYYVTETLLTSISYPRREHRMQLVIVDHESGQYTPIDTDGTVELADGYWRASTPDMSQDYSIEVHDHQVLEVLPIAPRGN